MHFCTHCVALLSDPPKHDAMRWNGDFITWSINLNVLFFPKIAHLFYLALDGEIGPFDGYIGRSGSAISNADCPIAICKVAYPYFLFTVLCEPLPLHSGFVLIYRNNIAIHENF